MSKTIDEVQAEIVSEFSLFESWMDKYNYIIDLGKSLTRLEDDYLKDDFLVKGCQSRVWLNATLDGDRLKFKADSDAIIVKGLIGLLLRVLSDQKPEDIIQADLNFVDKIGLKEHLSPTRSNGLVAMIKQMKLHALAYSSKQ